MGKGSFRFIKLMITWGILLAVALFYQNCQSFKASNLEDLNSQCVEKLRTDGLSEKSWQSDICESLENYECNLARFSPQLEDGNLKETECTILNNQEHCTLLAVHNFSTKHLLNKGSEPEELFAEGSSYNRSEYTCFHKELYTGPVPLIQAEADSLSGALNLAQRICRGGAQ